MDVLLRRNSDIMQGIVEVPLFITLMIIEDCEVGRKIGQTLPELLRADHPSHPRGKKPTYNSVRQVVPTATFANIRDSAIVVLEAFRRELDTLLFLSRRRQLIAAFFCILGWFIADWRTL
ncbi:hypothetical protein COO58_27310 [Micromonospora sp. WMMA1996]|nr:hypothetical protein COO58_27310 [Micromonospora sp. WMMA1996]